MIFSKMEALARAQELQTEKYKNGCDWCTIHDHGYGLNNYESFVVEWQAYSVVDHEHFYYYDIDNTDEDEQNE